jgi:hypothetical protein
MKLQPKGEIVADYTMLHEGRKYFNVWIGNPFMITLIKFHKNTTDKYLLIQSIKSDQKREKARFIKQFPEIEWKEMSF